MQEIFNKAEGYIKQNGTNLQKACMDYIAGRGDKESIIKELAPYQNTDGGWANGLEIEYPGTASTPYTTAAAMGYISKFELNESRLFSDTLKYLKNTQHKNGMWEDTDEMLKYPHPPYMGPGVYPEFKTGMVLKWLLRMNVQDFEMIDNAKKYLLSVFDEVSAKNDFWSAVAFSNAFSLMPEEQAYQKIMEWCMKILMPQDAQFGWQQAVGMIEDDIPIPDQARDIAINLIKQNQEQDGGWPHQFGTYNRVWSAIFILRYLKKIGKIDK